MITNNLEKLILAGKASYQNFCGISSGVMTLLCPEGKQIVLVDMEVTFPFKIFTSGLNCFYFKFEGMTTKQNHVISFFPPGLDTQTLSAGSQYQKNIYFAFQEDVRIRVATQLIAYAAIDYNPLTAEAQEPAAPAGYGGGVIPVNKGITFSGTDIYIPQNIKYSPTGLTVGMRNDPFPDIVAGVTDIPSPSFDAGFIINLGYVLLNKPQSNQFS